MATLKESIRLEPIELKHFLIQGHSWNVLLKPIVQNGKMLGSFGVYYPLTKVRESLDRNNLILLWVNLFGILIGIGGAIWLVRNIKDSLFGMEPKEIANLLSERTTLLQSTHEGIIAVDRFAKITLINAEAQQMFGLDSQVVGKALEEHSLGITAEELAQDTGLAIVSIRRYLQYLIDVERIKYQPVYGQPGRPVHRYFINND